MQAFLVRKGFGGVIFVIFLLSVGTGIYLD